MLTKERKKQLNIDLWIIAIVSFIVVMAFGAFSAPINEYVKNESVNIVWRVLFMGVALQFGLAGLGMTIVCILRKESFFSFGLKKEKLVRTIILSVLCCMPNLIYRLVIGDFHGWMPFISVHTTAEVLKSGFPENLIGMLITAICWGFFESFNYVVINSKINERYPSKNFLLNWGAIVCAVMCILIHGAIGVTPEAIMDMITTMFLIYGMLIVKDRTGNAWGCVFIFLFYWNAL